jgi:hypothetical protein
MLMIALHIVGGLVGVTGGMVALAARKGARLHRHAGHAFVLAMLGMGLSAVVLALAKRQDFNIAQGTLAVYLVVTGYAVLQRPTRAKTVVEKAAPVLACAVALFDAWLIFRPAGPDHGLPRGFVGLFAAIALLAAWGDLRLLRAGPPLGARRLARHVWRMTFALWIACASLFLGQARVLPHLLQAPAIRAVPVAGVLLVLVWWMWRLRRVRAGGPALPARTLPGAGG